MYGLDTENATMSQEEGDNAMAIDQGRDDGGDGLGVEQENTVTTTVEDPINDAPWS
jgi:hypothetical protein